MDRMFARTVRSGYSWNAGRLSLKEQDSGWAAEYTGICHILHFWCIYTLPGAEADKRRRLSTPGMAGADRCNSCFCHFMRLSFPKREQKAK